MRINIQLPCMHLPSLQTPLIHRTIFVRHLNRDLNMQRCNRFVLILSKFHVQFRYYRQLPEK